MVKGSPLLLILVPASSPVLLGALLIPMAPEPGSRPSWCSLRRPSVFLLRLLVSFPTSAGLLYVVNVAAFFLMFCLLFSRPFRVT